MIKRKALRLKKLIQINESKLTYIEKLLKFDFKLSEEEKSVAIKYFDKLNIMKTIELKLGERSYDIHVESGLLKKIPSILADQNHGQKWIIISKWGISSYSKIKAIFIAFIHVKYVFYIKIILII